MREGSEGIHMTKRSTDVFILFLVLTCLTAPSLAAGVDSSSVVFQSCSDLQFQPNTPYQYALSTVLSSLSTSAGFSTYGNFTSAPLPPSSPIYGLYQCHPSASLSGCESCVRSAATYLSTTPPCSSSASATLQLRGCQLRYGNDSFMGRADTSLLRRACGPAAAGGVAPGDIMAMRDAALGGVVGGSGQYRAGGAGYVDAVAQCVGDQGGGKQCSDCVAAAAEQLKDGCGVALSGEVYLGKCYVQYGVRGAYSYSAGGGAGGSAGGYDGGHGSSNDHASEAGKDIAIIIGIVAAVLLLILFLNYLHKSTRDKGKY